MNLKGIIKDKLNNNKNFEKKSNVSLNKLKKNKIYGGDKFKRLFSSINNNGIISKFNKIIDVNFDDTILTENKEKEKFENDIEQIKAILPENEKELFLKKAEKLGYNRDFKISKKRKNNLAYQKI